MSAVPSRFSLAAFRRYEPYLISYCATFPSPLSIDPTPFALETFASRCRDAARAHITNPFPSSLPTNFPLIWSASHLRITPPTITLAPRPAPTNPPLVLSPLSTTTPSPNQASNLPSQGAVLSKPSINTIRALLLLHDECVLIAPSRIENLSEELAEFIKNDTANIFFNVGVVFVDKTTCIIT